MKQCIRQGMFRDMDGQIHYMRCDYHTDGTSNYCSLHSPLNRVGFQKLPLTFFLKHLVRKFIP